jgi:ABC-type polysaccharide/polyol phosphate export permease
MKVEKQVKNFLTLFTMTIFPVVLIIFAYTTWYDGIHPASMALAMLLGTLMVFSYGLIASYIGVKKWIKKI